jgi:ATP-dependent Lhr-like helicase
MAIERWPEARSIWPDAQQTLSSNGVTPRVPAEYERDWDRSEAMREFMRGRMEITGPQTSHALAASFGVSDADVELALLALETEGIVLRGSFTQGVTDLEWCNRRLLARIHRYTLNRLRSEIQPASASEFMRFLFRWQRVEPGHRVSGIEGVASVIDQLDGFEIAAGAWENAVLTARCDSYEQGLLDMLCLSGRVAWGRNSPAPVTGSRRSTGPVRATPIALMMRENSGLHTAPTVDPAQLHSYARQVLEVLDRRGASFFHEIVAMTRMLPTQVEQGLGELVSAGAVTSDSFSGLRALLTPASKRASISRSSARRRRGAVAMQTVETAGRWSLLRPEESYATSVAQAPATSGAQAPVTPQAPAREAAAASRDAYFANAAHVERYARMLLKRYGVVFRRLITRETGAPPWRELLMVYRRLEARGEIRGGRFLQGPSGEQFALGDAVALMRSVRKEPPSGEVITISAVDPLNLIGIVTPEEARVPAITRNRILYRDGIAIASVQAGEVHRYSGASEMDDEEIARVAKRVVRPRVLYSERNATVGATRVARRAGT